MTVRSQQPAFLFPLKCICPDGRKLFVERMGATDLTEMYREVTKAAEAGKGYGQDEYETESEFCTEVKDGHNFVFKDATSLKTVAWLSIYYGGFCRSAKLVTPLLVVAESERNKHVAKFVGEFTIDYSAWRRFDGVLCDLFTVNYAVKQVLVGLGFKKVGSISISGKVKAQGYVGCDFMFYDLRGSLKGRRSVPQNGIYTTGVELQSKL